MSSLRHGVYRHYRGNLYEVLAVARDATGDEHRTVVVYRAVDGGAWWVRELDDFTAELHPDGTACRGARCRVTVSPGNVTMTRFTYVGPTLVSS